MPTFQFTGPDGKTYEVQGPDGATPEEAFSHLQTAIGQPSAPQQAAPAQPQTSQTLGFLEGAARPFDNAAQWLESGLSKLGLPTAAIDKATGSPSAADAAQSHQQYFRSQEASGKTPGKIGEAAGDMLSTLPLALVLRNPWLFGATSGALSSDKKDVAGIAQDAAMGAVGAKAGDVAIGALANAVAPKVSSAVRTLTDSGVQMTPGQIAGGVTKHVEDLLTHIPFIGDMVSSAQRNSVATFNRAVANRALSPIGESLPANVQAGHEAVSYVADKLGQSYDKLLSGLTLTPDQHFATAVQNLRSAAASLPKREADQFESDLQREIVPRIKPDANGNVVMTGDDLKAAETALRKKQTTFANSSDAYQQQLGDAYGGLIDELKGALERSNPGAAPQLAAINRGYANYARLRTAASKASPTPSGQDAGGVFTPGQLVTAVRQSDHTVGKGATAKGTALMQDLAEAGRAVLPSSVPDSGTAGRTIANGLIMGEGAKLLGLLNPTTAGAGLASAALYSKPGQKAAQFFMARNPSPTEQAIADLLNRLRIGALPVGPSLIAGPRND